MRFADSIPSSFLPSTPSPPSLFSYLQARELSEFSSHRAARQTTLQLHCWSGTIEIYSSVAPPSQQPQPSAAHAVAPSIDIESWTVSALQSLSVSPSARGTGVTLSIPPDSSRHDAARDTGAKTSYKPRKESIRRDSQKRRDALLKGKEGSRRRQRWENGR